MVITFRVGTRSAEVKNDEKLLVDCLVMSDVRPRFLVLLIKWDECTWRSVLGQVRHWV